jgi:hypothetical protein
MGVVNQKRAMKDPSPTLRTWSGATSAMHVLYPSTKADRHDGGHHPNMVSEVSEDFSQRMKKATFCRLKLYAIA